MEPSIRVERMEQMSSVVRAVSGERSFRVRCRRPCSVNANPPAPDGRSTEDSEERRLSCVVASVRVRVSKRGWTVPGASTGCGAGKRSRVMPSTQSRKLVRTLCMGRSSLRRDAGRGGAGWSAVSDRPLATYSTW